MRQRRPKRKSTGCFDYTYDQIDLFRDDKRDAYQEHAKEQYECEVCGEPAHETLPDFLGRVYLECRSCGWTGVLAYASGSRRGKT